MALRGIEEAARSGREGLKVMLEPMPGLTPDNLLGRNGFFFQNPPMDEFTHEYSHSHTDYDTIYSGQFSRPASRQLRQASFDTLAVDYGAYSFYNGVPIEEISEKLIDICESGAPVLFTAAHDLPPNGYANWSLTLAGPEAQFPVTVRSLKITEKAGEGDARYFSLGLTEYRDPDIAARSLRSGGRKLPTYVTLYMDGSAQTADGKWLGSPPQTPVTLHMIAKEFYGDPSKWGTIARANGIHGWSGSNALVAYPGYRSVLKKGGGRVPLPPDASKFRQVRVAKIKVPSVGQRPMGGGMTALADPRGQGIVGVRF